MTWDELSTATLDDVLAWAADTPWGRAMAACGQDAEYHAEGDVWTHTAMVARQLPQLDDWPTLPDAERTTLVLTAVFHDAGKPLTSVTDPVTGRVSSPKHAVKGEHLARAVLRGVGCPLAIREEVARMVRCHGRPVFLLEKPDPDREVITHSWWVSNRLLHLFTLADTRGRRTEQMTRPEENLHLWRLATEENGCFDRPYPFANDHARFTYFRRPGTRPTDAPPEFHRCTATMMSGLPGSGKDTWLARNRPGLPVVSLDDVRAELDVDATDDQGAVVQLARERCREYLRAGTSFAFNATSLLKQTRARWVELFADYDARVEIVYVEPPLALIHRRNKERDRTVPASVIDHLAGRVEPPTWAEAHRVILSDGN